MGLRYAEAEGMRSSRAQGLRDAELKAEKLRDEGPRRVP